MSFDLDEHDIVLKDEVDNAVIGVGARIKRSLVRAIRAGGLKDGEIRNKFAALQLEHSRVKIARNLLVVILTTALAPDCWVIKTVKTTQ